MFLIFNPFTNEDDKAETEEKVVAYLNSEPIYQSELTKEYERLDPTLQQMLDKNSILSQLIDKKVLLEQAKKTGVEADEEIQKIMEQNNLSIEELTENLAIQGFTVEEFKDQLKIFLFLDTEVFSGLEVNEAEVKEYYENNVEQFKIAESVRVRHILISSETRTEEEALEIMNEVEAIFEENNSKFCELVTDYSEDPGSLETCGEYPAFTRDSTFVQEYKDAAFENEVGEAKVVKTQFGYHLIQTLEKIPEKTFTFDEIKTELANSILYEKQKEAFTNYIQGLRTQIEIINCFETPENEMCKQEEDDDNKEKIETTTPISNVVLEPEINNGKEKTKKN